MRNLLLTASAVLLLCGLSSKASSQICNLQYDSIFIITEGDVPTGKVWEVQAILLNEKLSSPQQKEVLKIDGVKYYPNSFPFFVPGKKIEALSTKIVVAQYTAVKNYEFKIGQEYGGGIIFWIDDTGKHGLIAAKEDIGSSAQWCSTVNRINANNEENGRFNTDVIIYECPEENGIKVAAKLCRDSNSGGFTDWFLPSIKELRILFQQKDVVGGFKDEWYWSSTQSSSDYTKGATLNFGNGQPGQEGKKNNGSPNYNVRSIRTF